MSTDVSSPENPELSPENTDSASPAPGPAVTGTLAAKAAAKAAKKKGKPAAKAAGKGKAAHGKKAAPAKAVKVPATAGAKAKPSANGAKSAKPMKVTNSLRKTAYDVAASLKMISDPTRILVVQILGETEANVGDMAMALNVSQPALSHHLALLRHAGVAMPTRDGKNNVYILTDLGRKLAKIVDGLSARLG
jgi:DNA-binding transcriptional ArsR family regulator